MCWYDARHTNLPGFGIKGPFIFAPFLQFSAKGLPVYKKGLRCH
jgi:hypothetical protein